jgi:hypothetical protein
VSRKEAAGASGAEDDDKEAAGASGAEDDDKEAAGASGAEDDDVAALATGEFSGTWEGGSGLRATGIGGSSQAPIQRTARIVSRSRLICSEAKGLPDCRHLQATIGGTPRSP